MSQYTDTLSQVMDHAAKEGMVYQLIEDEQLNGKMVTVKGREMINFGSCSYLGLEYHPKLIDGAIDATRKFGTQFSSSRTYACLSMYQELENKLESIFGNPVVVTASTTLGHLATIPVVVEDNDAVILDMQVHSSIQMTVQMLKARGITMAVVRHNDMESLEKKLVELKAKHNKVWYFADGVYSMYGDFAPFDDLKRLLDKYPQFNLYIDDAHGASWAGKQGMGVVRAHMEHHERMILAISLNKSFAGGGGCIVFPDAASREKVRQCGGTLIFAGPIQPPMLGAIMASVDLHMSDEIVPMQESLMEMVDYCNAQLDAAGIPQFQKTDSPLFFIPCGLISTCIRMIQAIHSENIFVNTAAFPATPMKRGGIRFMITGHHTRSDIDALVAAIAKHYVAVLAEEGFTCKDVSRSFRIPEFSLTNQRNVEIEDTGSGLQLSRFATICDLDKAEWNKMYRNRGNMDYDTLKMLEEVFAGKKDGMETWNFHYFVARDAADKVVCAAFFTDVMTKDDMFSSSEVSAKVEEMRKEDPEYLMSRSVLLGSLITKGKAMVLDQGHEEWKPALKALLAHMQSVMDSSGATQLLMSEFVGEQDKELENFFLTCGLTKISLPATNEISGLNWNNQEEYVSKTIKGRYRNDFRREILRQSDLFDVVYEKPLLAREVDHLYDLYLNVASKSFELNVPVLPKSFFAEAFKNPDYDVIQLKLKGERESVAFLLSHKNAEHYSALIVGLNYDFVASHGTYKQILYRSVWRAWEMGCTKLDLAYTADRIKKKVGAKQLQVTAFVQSTDHFNHIQLSVL